MLTHIQILSLIMLAMGILGGIVNYLLTNDQVYRDLLSKKEAGSNQANQGSIKKMVLKSPTFWTNIVIGISATILVPLFLSTISSTLMDEADKNHLKYFVFAGFCLLAAIFSRKFILSMEEVILGKVKALEAKQEKSDKKIEAQSEMTQSLNLIQSFKDHINRLMAQVSIRPEDLQDFPAQLKKALDQELDATADTNLFGEAILVLQKARMCPMMNELINEYRDKIKIKEVTWVTAALANLDFYEIVEPQQEKQFYKNTVLDDCNKALELLPDYGEAIMTKIFLFAIDLLKAKDEKDSEAAKKEIESLFTFLLSLPNDVACYEATNAFDRNNKEGIFLFSYLSNLQKEFSEKLENVKTRGENIRQKLTTKK